MANNEIDYFVYGSPHNPTGWFNSLLSRTSDGYADACLLLQVGASTKPDDNRGIYIEADDLLELVEYIQNAANTVREARAARNGQLGDSP